MSNDVATEGVRADQQQVQQQQQQQQHGATGSSDAVMELCLLQFASSVSSFGRNHCQTFQQANQKPVYPSC